ncbi:MAG: 4-alpha-glucanotransferase [Candidatus Korobacteraceae bacterium]
MSFPRSSGILLHPTSLPSAYGIGELGAEAHGFADFLRDAGQRIWQVLPLGPTGYGDSPYQCFSAFAGNPLLISLDTLVERGYLDSRQLDSRPEFSAGQVDFGAVIAWKVPLLRHAFRSFQRSSPAEREAFAAFCERHSGWLDEFALFMALKETHDNVAWTLWDADLALHKPDAIERARNQLRDQIECHKFIQFEFERQWHDLKAHCGRNDIRIMGDVPIYVALDSADVWANRELFELDGSGRPKAVSGVPPDYFSATGQLWGNPIYRWEAHAKTGYPWWIARLRRSLEMLDLIRLDHFRGFEAYYEIPAGEVTAVNGAWVKGPGAALFEALENALGRLPIVAENLGVITPEVEALRERLGFPGMAILQFAFGKDPQAPDFKPHNYPHHLVAYTGTHDNDTAVGWWTSTAGGGSIRTSADVAEEMEYARRYLHTDGHEINWVMIRTLMASVADTVLFPLQDVLGVGSESRMNLPGTSSGNWRWRFRQADLTPATSARLRQLAETYER